MGKKTADATTMSRCFTMAPQRSLPALYSSHISVFQQIAQTHLNMSNHRVETPAKADNNMHCKNSQQKWQYQENAGPLAQKLRISRQ